VAVALLFSSPCFAQGLESLSLDHVRVDGAGRHELWVSALDGDGQPVLGLTGADFGVQLDGQPAGDLRVDPWGDRFKSLELTVVVDAGLLEGSGRRAIGQVIGRLGEAMGTGGRLRILVAARGVRSVEGSAADAGRLAERLPEGGGEARLYDALYDGVRSAVRTGGSTGTAVLVVTRGSDQGSRHGTLELWALLSSRSRPMPILIVLVEDSGAAPEGERLTRLAVRSGGASQRVTSTEAVVPAALRLAPRAEGAYALRFRAPVWDAKAERHQIEVAARWRGARRTLHEEYVTEEALAPPWWRRPGPYVGLLALVLGALAAALLLRPRRLFVLRVEAGPEEGCRYEVYAAPLTLGAADGNDVTLAETSVSRNHAVLERRGRGVEVVDLNSENGTFVNGERVSRRVLADGDVISLGTDVDLAFLDRS
jgi:hypothetical protein